MTPNHEHLPNKEPDEKTKAFLNDPKKMAAARVLGSFKTGGIRIDTDAMIRRLRGKE